MKSNKSDFKLMIPLGEIFDSSSKYTVMPFNKLTVLLQANSKLAIELSNKRN